MTGNNTPHDKVITVAAVYINEPVIFSHCVHLKLGHRFYALLKSAQIVAIIVPLTII